MRTILIVLKKSILFIAFYLSMNAYCQNEAYTLVFDINDKLISDVYIFSQFGLKKIKIDSAAVSSKRAQFNFKNKATGLYLLSYKYETGIEDEPVALAEVDFIFHQDKIHLNIIHKDKKAEVNVIASDDNKTWHEFKLAEAKRNSQIKYIFSTKELFEDEKDIMKALKSKLKKEEKEQSLLIKKSKANYNKSFVNQLIYHTSLIVPPFEFDKDEIFAFVYKDLFERCDFNKESLLNSNVYENIVFNYIISQYQKYSLRNEQEIAVQKAVEKIMLKAEKNQAIKSKMLKFIINGLTQLDAQVALNYLLEKYPESEKCSEGSDSVNIENEIKVGDFVSKDVFKLIHPKDSSLKVRQNTLLIFWASWCPYSENLRNELSKFSLPEHISVTIVSLSKGIENCKSDRLLFPGKYTFLCEGKRWDNEIVNNTGINSIPNLLLIDESGKVIQKPENLSELQLKSD